MERFIKNLIQWDKKTDAERDAFRERVGAWRYQILSVTARLLCIFPIPLRFWLRISLSDKHRPGRHLYGYTYGRLFWKFKYRRIKLLEIGIGGYKRHLGGESLNAWQGFFPFAQIIGCDIERKEALAGFRTKIYQLDQSSKTDLDALCEREKAFDIIIDDGSHLSRHQIFTFEMLFSFLKDGGIYIVEDVQTSYWHFDHWDGAFITDPQFSQTCVGYFLNLTKYINHSELSETDNLDRKTLELARSIKQVTFEHNLIIVSKGPNLLPSNILSTRHVASLH
jgi:hypothetical protein